LVTNNGVIIHQTRCPSFRSQTKIPHGCSDPSTLCINLPKTISRNYLALTCKHLLTMTMMLIMMLMMTNDDDDDDEGDDDDDNNNDDDN
jgi:hypothetical protein